MSRKDLMKVYLGILFVIFLTSTANALTFSDGTFNNEDWTLNVITEGNGGTVTASQQTSGGNTGSYRQTIDVMNPSPSSVRGYHLQKSAVYNPSLQGAIISIDGSRNSKMFVGFGAGQDTGFALYQGGNYFMYHIVDSNTSVWTNYSKTGLKAEDFFVFLSPTLHPDFSTSGGPITFGYMTSNSAGPYSITNGVDNWSVTLNTAPVPLPGALILFGTGLPDWRPGGGEERIRLPYP